MHKAKLSLKKQIAICWMMGASLWAGLSFAEPAAPQTPKTNATYVVQSGDIFGKVCQKFQPAGVPLKTVMHDVFVANKSAFKNGRQADLIVGSTLQIPQQYQASPQPETPPAPQDLKAASPTKNAAAPATSSSAQEAVISTTEEAGPSQTFTSQLTESYSSVITWLNNLPKTAILITLLVVALGAYLRKRKLLIEAQRKAIEDLFSQKAKGHAAGAEASGTAEGG